MRATLARAEKVQAACNCFITLCAEQALAAAAAADKAVAQGAELGPLHGVPFHVKDLVNTEGVRTTFALLHARAQRAEGGCGVAWRASSGPAPS